MYVQTISLESNLQAIPTRTLVEFNDKPINEGVCTMRGKLTF